MDAGRILAALAIVTMGISWYVSLKDAAWVAAMEAATRHSSNPVELAWAAREIARVQGRADAANLALFGAILVLAIGMVLSGVHRHAIHRYHAAAAPLAGGPVQPAGVPASRDG